MTIEEAWEILKNPESKKPSEIGEAIDVLLRQRRKIRKRGEYKWLSGEIGKKRIKINGYRRSFTPSEFHKIYRLPQGIRWKVDRREIKIPHGLQIARLESEEDQWLLALAIDYAAGDSDKSSDQLSEKDCKNIVKRVLEKEDSIRNIIGEYGVRFKDIPMSVAFSSPEEWIAVSKEAWNRHMNRPAFCSHLIAQKYSVLSDIEKVVEQLEELNQKLQSQFLAKIADELQKLAELRHPAAEEAVQKPEAEEKEKPNGAEDFGENPSVFLEEGNAEKEADVQSGDGEPESAKPSGDGGQSALLNGGDDKTKGKRKKKSAKKSGNMKRR